MNDRLNEIKNLVDQFTLERDWEKFHTVKNLIMALNGEVGELNEVFQWKNESECLELMNDKVEREKVENEVADVFVYLLRICSVLNIDIDKATMSKLEHNRKKYPVELCKGSAKKYNELRKK